MTGALPRSKGVVRAAVAKLSSTDLLRLKSVAQFASRKLGTWGWEDLLQEALSRALDGSRSCPSHVPVLTFLVQTMRSLANEEWERAFRPAALAVSKTGLVMAEQAAEPDPERALAAAQELAEVRGWFAGDSAALALIDGMGRGDDADEIRRRARLDERGYLAAQKRIRRTVVKKVGEKT